MSQDREKWMDLFEQGWEAGSAGDIDKAIALFGESASLAPQEPKPRYQLGYSYLLKEDYRQALDAFRAVDRLSRGYFIVQVYASICEQALAGAIAPQTVRHLLGLQMAVDQGAAQSPQVATAAEELVRTEPDCGLGYFYLGKALLNRDRARSEEALRQCLERAPDDTTAIDALGHLAILREAAGDPEGARSIREQALARYGDHPHLVWIRRAPRPAT